jgi:DNA-binding response OmpR family regulator
MQTPPRILIVDDQPMNVDILKTRLMVHGYEILTTTDGEEALTLATTRHPDLMLLDILMPKLDGIELCRRLKEDASLPFMPVIMITAKSGTKDVVAGLEAGADEYLTKPVDQAALVARVKSMLRLKALHDTTRDQTDRLQAEMAQLQSWTQTLEHQMHIQVQALKRLGRLKRFLPAQLSELLVSPRGAERLRGHQREIAVVCCALEGFTTFVETTLTESVFDVLRDYHRTVGQLAGQFHGTLERFAGDWIRVIFNDPFTCPDPAWRALELAHALRQQLVALRDGWRASGYGLDFGIGVAHGKGTLGVVGFEGRVDYAVMGAVRQLASRLCQDAQGGKILVSPCLWETGDPRVHVRPAGEHTFDGQTHPVPVFEVMGLTLLDEQSSAW